ncbi:hypothetical protein CASFOL_001336 [Castilleja foliolosa]|uniref:Uncharacterized protein n=1 Tax=Castilleja foliolosa TaxID=1961234 RepID=A0ABD3EMU1_9LAMI
MLQSTALIWVILPAKERSSQILERRPAHFTAKNLLDAVFFSSQ